MPRDGPSKTNTSLVRERKSNGYTYVYERTTAYDPNCKYTRTLSKKLLGKIPPGGTEMVPTRPKAPPGSKTASKQPIVNIDVHTDVDTTSTASAESVVLTGNASGTADGTIYAVRKHTGMMDIIEHIGSISGIDNAVYEACPDKGTAQKIISIARYLFGTDGRTLPSIVEWQPNHPVPYAEGISEDIYHNLFVEIGNDETIRQSYFIARAQELTTPACLALDTTTISTYSKNIEAARIGFNKDGDELKTVKYLCLYSIDSGQPVAYAMQPGNVPDVGSVENTLAQLEVLDLDPIELFMDNGFYSSHNVADLLRRNRHFIMIVKNSIKWVREAIDEHREELESTSTMCPFERTLHGITVTVDHTFHYVYSENNSEIREAVPAKIMLHIFYDGAAAWDNQAEFDYSMHEIRNKILKNRTTGDLSEEEKSKMNQYLIITRDDEGNIINVDFNNAACKERKNYHGIFVLIADNENDTFRALKKYRNREKIEDYFKMEKDNTDGKRTRVWDSDTLHGRMLVQFIALCYREYYSRLIYNIKHKLAKEIDDETSGTKKLRDLKRKLLNWINQRSLFRQLEWFDAIETVEVHVGLVAKRWSTETTKRDRLFLHELGMLPESDIRL